MWDNVRLLNIMANALFGLAIAAFLWAGAWMLLRSPAFPLRSIQVEGQLRHVGRADIMAALQGRLSGTFFNMDLDGVRAMFEGIPWVRHAEVRRLWPDRLEVRIEEQVALAHWGAAADGRLVNTHGEVFSTGGVSEAAALPYFSGPEGSAADVAVRYAEFRSAFAPLAVAPVAVSLSPRYSWQLRLSSGLAVQLGRDNDRDPLTQRLARFINVYPRTLAPLAGHLQYVDLRYPDGFATRLSGVNLDGDKPDAGHAAASGTRAQPGNAHAQPGTRAPHAAAKNIARRGGIGRTAGGEAMREQMNETSGQQRGSRT